MGRCFLPQVNPPHYCQRGERINFSVFCYREHYAAKHRASISADKNPIYFISFCMKRVRTEGCFFSRGRRGKTMQISSTQQATRSSSTNSQTSQPVLLPAQKADPVAIQATKRKHPDSCIWASRAFPYSNPKWYFIVKYCYLLRNARPKE